MDEGDTSDIPVLKNNGQTFVKSEKKTEEVPTVLNESTTLM